LVGKKTPEQIKQEWLERNVNNIKKLYPICEKMYERSKTIFNRVNAKYKILPRFKKYTDLYRWTRPDIEKHIQERISNNLDYHIKKENIKDKILSGYNIDIYLEVMNETDLYIDQYYDEKNKDYDLSLDNRHPAYEYLDAMDDFIDEFIKTYNKNNNIIMGVKTKADTTGSSEWINILVKFKYKFD